VYNSSGNCCLRSSAFIDASMFANSPPIKNFCRVLNFILNPSNGVITSVGAVIDARGLTNMTMTCSASPWAGITSPPPSTILLPVGTIGTSATWSLPANTRLIGAGDNISPSTLSSGTIIRAVGASVSPLIQLGSSSLCSLPCTGISVENLTLDGQGQAINGIVNQNATTNTFVDHVGLYQILGTGLYISGQ